MRATHSHSPFPPSNLKRSLCHCHQGPLTPARRCSGIGSHTLYTWHAANIVVDGELFGRNYHEKTKSDLDWIKLRDYMGLAGNACGSTCTVHAQVGICCECTSPSKVALRSDLGHVKKPMGQDKARKTIGRPIPNPASKPVDLKPKYRLHLHTRQAYGQIHYRRLK